MSIPQSPSPADGTKAIPWLWLGVIVLAAAAVRGVVWGLTLIIGADGPAFLEIAALFGKGEVEAAIGHPTHYHPFYPALVSLASRWIESPQCAGEAVSFFFGVLTPIPLFFLARRFTGDAVALAAATILAAHPIAARLSVDLKSDSTYAFLFVCSVWLSWETITGRHKAIAFLAGLSAGLAYLTRPEGLGVILVAAPWLLLEKKEGWGKRLALAGTLLLGALLPATPYAAEISRQAGEFRITRKKSLSDFIGAAERPARLGEPRQAESPAAVDSSGEIRIGAFLPLPAQWSPARESRREGTGLIKRMGLATLEVVGEFFQNYHVLLGAFLFIGVLSTRALPRPRTAELFLGLLCLLYFAILFLLVVGVGYLSRRHVYPLCVIALPWGAAGIRECARWIGPHLARVAFTAPFAPESRAAALLLGGMVIILAPKTFYPHRLDQLTQREAGFWIRAVTGGSDAPILTHMEKVAYYAGCKQIPLQKDYGTSIDIARRRGARYAAIYAEKVHRVPPKFFEDILPEDLNLVASFRHYERRPLSREAKKIHLYVFEILYPEDSELPPKGE